MIIYTDTNLFLSPAQTLVNTVNTVGVMGRGIAKDFKHYYPQMFDHYRAICQAHQLDVGQLLLSKEEPELRPQFSDKTPLARQVQAGLRGIRAG